MRKRSENNRIDPSVREILLLLAGGVFLAASFAMPGLPIIAKPFLDAKREQEQKQWEKYNLWRLRQVIKRLETQRVIEVAEGEVKITEKGKKQVLKFQLEDMELTKKTDGKWRLVLYDISDFKKNQREIFRTMLKKLKFLRIQKSVYLTPFACEREIEYLRQMFNIGKEVVVLKVIGIEHESEYRKYFGI